MVGGPTPRAVTHALRRIGEDLVSWRKLRQLTIEQVADRAGIGVRTVARLERGEGATLENALRVARALGVLEHVVASFDPFETDLGRARADAQLPQRVRRARRAP